MKYLISTSHDTLGRPLGAIRDPRGALGDPSMPENDPNMPFFPFYSIPSTTNSPLRGDFSNRGGIKSFTALILETIEDNETMYYLIPKHLAKKGKLKKRGTKLHICQDHMFLAKHIKR